MRSFAMVASALGDRFRVRLRIAGDQAFTDGELVVLPQLPEGSEYTEAAWGYLVHEAAHLRFTDFELANRRCVEMPDLYRHIWNIFEDLRIEPALAALYPGVPRMINNVITRLIKDGVFKGVSPESHPARVLIGYLLYAGRCEVVGQALLLGIAAQTEESLERVFPSIAADVKQVLSRVSAAKSTADTLASADEILSLLDQTPQQQPTPGAEGAKHSPDSRGTDNSDAHEAGDQRESESHSDSKAAKDSMSSDDSGGPSDSEEATSTDNDSGKPAEPHERGDDQGDQGADNIQVDDADEGLSGDDSADSAGDIPGSSTENAEIAPGLGASAPAPGIGGRALEQAKAYSQGTDGSVPSDLGVLIARRSARPKQTVVLTRARS